MAKWNQPILKVKRKELQEIQYIVTDLPTDLKKKLVANFVPAKLLATDFSVLAAEKLVNGIKEYS